MSSHANSSAGALPLSVISSLALILPLCLAVAVLLVVFLAALTKRRPKLWMRKLDIKPGAKTNKIYEIKTVLSMTANLINPDNCYFLLFDR